MNQIEKNKLKTVKDNRKQKVFFIQNMLQNLG